MLRFEEHLHVIIKHKHKQFDYKLLLTVLIQQTNHSTIPHSNKEIKTNNIFLKPIIQENALLMLNSANIRWYFNTLYSLYNLSSEIRERNTYLDIYEKNHIELREIFLNAYEKKMLALLHG